MIVGIDGEAADLAEQPVVGQRLGTEGIDLELRRVGRGGGRRKRDKAQQGCKGSPPRNTLHRLLRRFLVSTPPLPVGACQSATPSACRGHGSSWDPSRFRGPGPWRRVR